MKPIIELVETHPTFDFSKQIRNNTEEHIYRCVVNVGVNVDKERLLQALKDARAFYDEGYADGKRDSEPKKPFVDMNDFYKCPCCHTVVKTTDNFCHECGVGIDWSDENV